MSLATLLQIFDNGDKVLNGKELATWLQEVSSVMLIYRKNRLLYFSKSLNAA